MTEQLPPNPGGQYHRSMGMEDPEGLEQSAIPGFLRDPAGVFRRRWRWMLLALVVGVFATAAFVALMNPLYVAIATIQVTDQQIPKELVRSTIQDDPLARINAMLGTILSQREIATLIEAHDLFPELRNSAPLSEIVDMTRSAISVEEKSGIGPKLRGQGTQLYTVSFESDRADVAADVANEIAGRLTLESIRVRTRQATAITEFLRRELERAEAELREQNQKITAFKEQHRGELPSELATNLSKMDRLQMQRQSLSLQIAEAETRLATLATTGGVATDQDGGSPEQQLFALRQQLSNELTTRTEGHPDVVALRRKISALEQDASLAPPQDLQTPPSRGSLLEGSQRTIAALKAQLAETDRNLRLLDERVAGTPARDEALIALEEQEGVLRENYLGFLRKVQEAELAQSLESTQHGERFSIVDPAAIPTSASQKRWQFAGLGVLASLALSLAVGVLLEIRDPVLVSADQLEMLAELPVLGSVPRI
jgi:succinoglycan biosynthesis transport protein ExoP